MLDLMQDWRKFGRGFGPLFVSAIIIGLFSPVLRGDDIPVQPVMMKTLSNGLTVLIQEDHSAPLVAVNVMYHVGIKDEPPGLTGMSQLCEKLMYEGTPHYPKGEFSRIIQSGGGSISSMTDYDVINFSSKGAISLLDSILLLEADRMQNIDITYEKLFAAREAAKKDRLSLVEGSLYGPINEEAFNLSFRAHPYQHPYYGWPSDLESLTLDDIREYFRKYIQPANAIIVIVGDVAAVKTVEEVQKYFGNIPALPLPARRPVAEPEQRGERTEILENPSQIPVVLIAYHIGKIGSPDNTALNLIRRVLVGGGSARLYQTMVLDKKSAVSLGGNLIELEDAGLIFFYALLNYDASVDTARKVMIDEIERLGKEMVPPGELEKVKNQRESEYYRYNSTLDQKAAWLGYYYLLTGDWSTQNKELAASRGVTAADIKTIAARYLRSSNRNVILQKPLQPYTGDSTVGDSR
ncbi:putative Uncharacterized zinc protease y4wA [Candidatus Zixiibacteriota bacterium]|nr:putative Uncharacterized zinc protease y4wA [candidate division Zixibacteria bacterium]